MRKIAVPVFNGILSTHFGHCDEFQIFDTENSQINNSVTKKPPVHQPGILPAWLHDLGVTDVIAGGMGQRAIHIFNQNSINVYTGAPVKTPEEVVTDFLNGTLVTTENLCDH
jgi:predicted Fe-Mo cluster-binding NifX family protein